MTGATVAGCVEACRMGVTGGESFGNTSQTIAPATTARPTPAPTITGILPPRFTGAAGKGGALAGVGAGGRAGAAARGATMVSSLANGSSNAVGIMALPEIAARSASAKSAALSNRSSGRRAMARATTPSKAGGDVTASSDGRGGVVVRALCMIAVMLPSNGRSPVRS